MGEVHDEDGEVRSYGPSEQHVTNILSQLPPDSFIRNYVQMVGGIADVHLAHQLVAGLGLLAQTIPDHIGFPFGGHPLHANIFGMLVGSSGSRKTVAVSNVLTILNIAGMTMGCGLRNVVCVPPASREAFYDSLTDSPKKLISYTEFGDFLAASAQSYLTPLRTAYNDAADCAPLTRTRVKKRGRNGEPDEGGDSGHAEPRVSLLGAVAQPFLDAHTDASDWGGGFFARFMMSCYERERYFILPDDGEATLTDIALWIHDRYDEWCNSIGDKKYGQCGGLTPAARAWYFKWAGRIDRPMTSNVAVGAATNRLGPLALKIALILAWDVMAPRNGQMRGIETTAITSGLIPPRWLIPEGVIQTATQIVEDIHYKSVKDIVGDIADTREERLVIGTRRALTFADRDGRGLTRGELGVELRRSPRDIQAALDALIERGEVKKSSRQELGESGVTTTRNDVWVLTNGFIKLVDLDSAREARRLFGEDV